MPNIDYNIGRFNSNALRKRPTQERVAKYLSEMEKPFNDYDVYLWGSWPQKNTWDVDFLAHNPDILSSQGMEDVFLSSLDSSLNKNNFMADLGFTDRPIIPFNDIVNRYNNTGMGTPTAGYIYGDKWYADGQVFKDRAKAADVMEGSLEYMGNDVYRKQGSIPYKKMVPTLSNGNFEKWYKDKPILIKERNKIYGKL